MGDNQTELEVLPQSEEELNCLIQIKSEGKKLFHEYIGCPRVWDSLLCWPPTAAGTRAQLPCFAELDGIKYDTTKNATRWCHLSGKWDNYTDYSSCSDLATRQEFEPGLEVTTMIYFGGYTMSLVALSVAVWIFIFFKDLRCLRNTIHTNLMFTYMLADFMWILTMILQKSVQSDITACAFLIVLLHYFHLTNFFWMFVEGLYLYMLVVETFTSGGIKLRSYICIGWGIPAVIVIIWATAKSFTQATTDLQTTGVSVLRHCPWMTSDTYDWIYQTPALGVLAVNLIFLVLIMWVLITKLRSANTAETQQSRKAAKALLVLIPLLGITYILVITGPTEGVSADIYTNLRAILLSTQGFTVALFYCFLNTEVQNSLRHYFERWKESRDIGARRYTYTKDSSPSTRTESIKLCQNVRTNSKRYRKRESTVSETTMMTIVGGGSSTRVSNGSVGAAVTIRTSISPYFDKQPENAV